MLTSMDYTILGILAHGAKSGYDVKRVFELSPSIEYSASAGAIYPALKRLERQHLVEGKREIQELRPNRTVYRLTETGRAELVKWLKTPPGENDYPRVHSSLLAKMLFLSLLPRGDAVAFLRAAKQTLEAQLKRAGEFAEGFGKDLDLFQQLLLEGGIVYLRSQVGLVEKALVRLGDVETRRCEDKEEEEEEENPGPHPGSLPGDRGGVPADE